MSKLRIAPPPDPPQPASAPLLTLDQLEILSSTGEPRPRFTAEGLAALLSYGEETSVDGFDVELRLAGLVDLLRATTGGDQTPGRDAVYFIAETLADIRALLQSDRSADRYRVRVVAPKAVAS